MKQLKIEIENIEDANEIFELAEHYDDIEMIQEKNFNGDITIIELYISATINIITIVSVVIKALIKEKKISSLYIDGDKIDIKNIPVELVEKIIDKKMNDKNVK